MNFLILNILFELVCLCFAIICLSKERTFWIFFVPYLTCVVITESTGMLLFLKGAPTNAWIFNLYMPVSILFICYTMYRICSAMYRIFRILVLLVCCCSILYVYELITSGVNILAFRTFALSNIGYIIVCCAYFYHLLKQEHFVNIGRHAEFWLLAGLLFHAFGSTMCLVFFEVLSKVYYDYHIPLRQIIFVFLNFIMYACWSYAFLCRYRFQTSSSSYR